MTARGLVAGVTAAALVAAIGDVAAQNRETLETKVTITDTEITFKWSNKHPWDAALIANGASLFAEYRTANGGGVECMQPGGGGASAPAPVPAGRGRVPAAVPPFARTGAGGCYAGNAVFRKDDRVIQFKLPDRLTAEPIGPVCLQLRLPDQRLLPIRQASRTGGDTVRFQVDEWSAFVAAGARQARIEARRAELTTAMLTQTQEIGEQDTSNRQKGWTSLAACATQQGGTVEIAGSGRPVAAPNLQDATARQVCTLRVANAADRNDGVVRPPGEIVTVLNAVDPESQKRWLRVRGQQLQQFVEDWKTFSPRIDAYRAANRSLPHFGTYGNLIAIQSLAEEAQARILQAVRAKQAISLTDFFGYAGASVEAYNRCVTDGKEQLALNYTQSQQLAATVESLPERLRQQAVQTCQAGVNRLASMQTRLQGFQQELAKVESEVAASAKMTAPPRIRSRELNAAVCAP